MTDNKAAPPLLPCPFCGGEAYEGPHGIRCATTGCVVRIGAALSPEQWNRRTEVRPVAPPAAAAGEDPVDRDRRNAIALLNLGLP
jgi:hypothetical protein